MKADEHKLQVACVKWFQYQYPKHLLFAIPNGGQRTAIQGAILKREGVVAGIPDLCLAAAHGSYFGMYIELKVGKNKPSVKQAEIHDALKYNNYKVVVCWSIEQFQETINQYLKSYKTVIF